MAAIATASLAAPPPQCVHASCRQPRASRVCAAVDGRWSGRNVKAPPRAGTTASATSRPSAAPATVEAPPSPDRSEFRFWTAGGGAAHAAVTRGPDGFSVRLELTLPPAASALAGESLFLHWGLFRSSAAEWSTPRTLPKNSVKAAGAVRTPLTSHGPHTHACDLFFPSKLAPFTLAFTFYASPLGEASPSAECDPDSGRGHYYGRPPTNASFSLPVGMTVGVPSPEGLSRSRVNPGLNSGLNSGLNFALYARSATAVSLCLYAATPAAGGTPALEIALEPSSHRTGDVWHVALSPHELAILGGCCTPGAAVTAAPLYGWRVAGGVDSWATGGRFEPASVMLDPYATCLAPPPAGAVAAPLLGSLAEAYAPPFDWGGTLPPRRPAAELVVYSLDVALFTSHSSAPVAPEHRGTYLGLAECVGHLVSLGINAVLLRPLTAEDPTSPDGAAAGGPLNFFAPSPALAVAAPGEGRPVPVGGASAPSHELKTAIKALHAAGIEVFLESVLDHTSERGDGAGAGASSLRGIDCRGYYRFGLNNEVIVESVGQGHAALAAASPPAARLIHAALRRWAVEFRIGGFLIPRADRLTRPSTEGAPPNPAPPILESLAYDPILGGPDALGGPPRARLIASPAEGSPPLGNSFPHWGIWAEAGPAFGDDTRRFVRGDAGALSALASRLCGSGDVVSGGRGPGHSYNALSTAGGRTLADAVGYGPVGAGPVGVGSEPESGEVACVAGDSAWCRGPTADVAVASLRRRQGLNLLLIQMVALGPPLMRAGDEYGHTGGGAAMGDPSAREDHAFRWDLLAEDDKGGNEGGGTARFLRALVAFRGRRAALFSRPAFPSPAELTWHGRRAHDPEWADPGSRFLAVTLRSPGGRDCGDVYIAFNAESESVVVGLPAATFGMTWHRLADTSLPVSEFVTPVELPPPAGAPPPAPGVVVSATSYTLPPHSSLILESLPPGSHPMAAITAAVGGNAGVELPPRSILSAAAATAPSAPATPPRPAPPRPSPPPVPTPAPPVAAPDASVVGDPHAGLTPAQRMALGLGWKKPG